MKIHRFIFDFEIKNKEILSEDAELINQIKNVLRLKSGDKLVLCDGNSNEAESEVKIINSGQISFRVIKEHKNTKEKKGRLALYASLLKKDKFEFVAQKVTELSVSEIIPIISERTEKLNLNYERLRKIIKEAAEQSGRGIVPEIKEIISFAKALEDVKSLEGKILFDPSGEEIAIGDKKLNSLGVFVGPEGGWTEKELDLAKEAGFKIAKLGDFTLRAETADMVAVFEGVKLVL